MMKMLMRKGLALTAVLAVMLSLVLTGCSVTSNGMEVAEAKSGTVRVYCTYEAYCGELELELGDDVIATFGSAFGVGDAGKKTDIFVTNAHVLEYDDQTYTIGDILNYAYDTYTALSYIEYLASVHNVSNEDVYNIEVTVSYTLKQVYLLEDDYSLIANADGSMPTVDTNRAVPCKVLYKGGADELDLAVLQASEPMEGRIALPIMNTEDLVSGDTIYALGYPAVADYLQTTDYPAGTDSVIVTTGTVAMVSTDSALNYDVILHDATVNSGNSGGPLVTENGAVVGVNTIRYSDGDYSVSITSEEVMAVLDLVGVDYEMYEESTGLNIAAIGGIAAAVVIVIIIAAVFIMKRKKKTEPAPAPAPASATSPATVPEPQPIRQTIAGDSGLRIQAVTGVFAGRRFAIQGQMRIGRDPKRNDLVYPEGTRGISGVHCELKVVNGTVYLSDAGSTYGTYLQSGQRLAANESAALKPGESFYLATESERFVIVRRGEG